MSDKLNDKQQAAMRLFGALSGVDEKYLAACEDDKEVAGQKGVVVIWRRYGKGIAAVLCLAVLGAGYVGVQMSGGFMRSDMTAATSVNMAASQACEAESPEMKQDGVAGDAMFDSVTNGAGELGGKEAGSEFVPGAEGGAQTEDVRESVSQPNQEEMPLSVEFFTLEEAVELPGVGAFVPTEWPVDGDVTEIVGLQTDNGRNIALVYTYSNQKEGFSVSIEELGAEVPTWVEAELESDVFVREDEFTKEFVDKHMRTDLENMVGELPYGAFGVLYETQSGYVLVRFNGYGTAETVWALMQ